MLSKEEIARVRKMDIREVVKEEEWQALRVSFLGTWNRMQAENVLKLRAYLGDMSDAMRIRRVLNYLTGTAFRIGSINSPEIEKLREEVRAIWQI